MAPTKSKACNYEPKETERKNDDDKVSLLYSAWSVVLLNKSSNEEANQYLMKKHGISESNLPNAPHLENCKVKQGLYERLDKREGNQRFPPWTSWKGFLNTHPIKNLRLNNAAFGDGAYPPWVCMYVSCKLHYKHFFF